MAIENMKFRATVIGAKLNNDGEIICGNKINVGDVFTNESGEWTEGFCKRTLDDLYEAFSENEKLDKLCITCPDNVFTFEFKKL